MIALPMHTAGVRKRSVIPGFRLSLGYTVFYLSVIVLIPLVALFVKGAGVPVDRAIEILTDRAVIASFRVSFLSAGVAAFVNLIFGTMAAYVLCRYDFLGRRIVDAAMDLPFALPTAVAGISLTALYAKDGWIGSVLEPLGVQVAYSQAGIIVALIFIGVPFVVRSVQPVLEELPREEEEAAALLGAGRLYVIVRIILPAILPAALTGFVLSFARSLGEYGSVVFISGNLPFKTEIVPLMIVKKLEQYDYEAAALIGIVMLLLSFCLMGLINLLQMWAARRMNLKESGGES
ncbi:sulfate ABC transporter permease subunit CysT [Leptonema illini]|uniref:Sulfate transport system permease protein CysT n=1 Tax=Leptonema illini DSM 21528 TaxID=929563 RepID=H2CDN4_9LEPT|nr:sulfate ABC transporter permease subunit CysT [Leptonema illini]EHQ07572.1 sulfate ABC transporter, inner membrane subunit CysT [Leptonema illini DSM 21528]